MYYYIRFTVSDGNGGVATKSVIINLCNCSSRGNCKFETLASGYYIKDSFRIVQCNCSVGWEGNITLYKYVINILYLL